MKLARNRKSLFLLSAALVAFLSTSTAEAGVLKVTNHSRNNIRIEIVSEPYVGCLPYCWKCLEGCYGPYGQQIKTIKVPLDAFKGNTSFAIIGTEGGILFNGECRNLSITKDYEVSFSETFFGLTCKSKEIQAL